MTSAAMQQTLLLHLREDFLHRRMQSGLSVLEENRWQLEALSPEEPGAIVLLSYVAMWVDAGFDSPALLKRLFSRFSAIPPIQLPLIEFVHLRIADAVVAMADEDFERAAATLQFVGSIEEHLRDSELLALAWFWTSRCLRRMGRYDDAWGYIVKARTLALENGLPQMAAVMRINESWMMFQKGRIEEATQVLDEANAVLAGTDDAVSLGNIQSAYGRLARRQGLYARALDHFQQSINLYARRDPCHPNLGRSRENIAWVLRLMSLQLQKKIDRESARRKAASGPLPAGGRTLSTERAELQDLRSKAFHELDQAEEIYVRTQNHRGIGAARINRGFLYFDAGDWERAGSEGAAAFELCRQKHDYIPMARARILQCMLENMQYDEQIGAGSELHRHAQCAHDYARDAVELASKTQNRRLLARAYVWQGLTFTSTFFNDPEAARHCCNQATALLRTKGREEQWDDLQELKTRILHKARMDTVLKEWAQGLVGDKSFQQISEEFAAIVISRVWEREGRKVSRVAEKLSVSPKKVRRVLHASGVLNDSDSDDE